jgi:hypothetical protein
VWQLLHWAELAKGMWLAGRSTPVKALVLPWHWLQSPALGCAGSATLKVLEAVRGRV